MYIWTFYRHLSVYAPLQYLNMFEQTSHQVIQLQWFLMTTDSLNLILSNGTRIVPWRIVPWTYSKEGNVQHFKFCFNNVHTQFQDLKLIQLTVPKYTTANLSIVLDLFEENLGPTNVRILSTLSKFPVWAHFSKVKTWPVTPRCTVL